MAFGERWLAAAQPFVRERLPQAPARVIELGCGPSGGYVPALLAAGYDALGIDRNAPEGAAYERIEFERYAPARPADAIVASRSLHHVADVAEVLDAVAAALRPGGTLIVLEWAWEHFDDATARWCFARLGRDEAGDLSWLTRRRAGWAESGEPWDRYFAAWAAGHGLQPGELVLAELGARFAEVACARGPYFFADLDGVSEADEQAAIDAGEIRATGIRYAGVR
jgi:SAM-dependent methyltransferase